MVVVGSRCQVRNSVAGEDASWASGPGSAVLGAANRVPVAMPARVAPRKARRVGGMSGRDSGWDYEAGQRHCKEAAGAMPGNCAGIFGPAAPPGAGISFAAAPAFG